MKTALKTLVGLSLAYAVIAASTPSQAVPGCPVGYVWSVKMARCLKVGVLLDWKGDELPTKIFQVDDEGKLIAVKARKVETRNP